MRTHLIEDSGAIVSTILVGRGIASSLASLIGNLERPPGRVAVLCQPSTMPLAEHYAQSLAADGFASSGFTLPDGEEAKQMGVVEDVYRHLNGEGFTRNDLVIGVGGGALTDVAGFVAGTYLRGIPAVYVPTTLLGAVDAAIGGKTGVNVDGKNLAGVFKHPAFVVIDVNTLDALPDVQKIEGAAEAIKTGFIADMEIADAYERNGLDVDLEDIVNRSVAVKAAVVCEDFREHGRRAVLNYGHTVGHAIETATGRSHGQSVAIGMVAAGAASLHVFGFDGHERQKAILQGVGLQTAASDAKAQQIMSLMALDKKRDTEGLRMVLLHDFGQPAVVGVDDATVRAALEAVGVSPSR
jgi:3-dehydroquinate synthase